MKIEFGYACVSILHETLRCNRSSTKTYLDRHSKEECRSYLLGKAKQNLVDLALLLEENYKNKIMAYRLPEQVLPQIDLGYYEAHDLREELRMVGNVANNLKMQLSTHPSQYYVLNSLRSEVVEKSIYSLNCFASVLEAMELRNTPNLTLHVGTKNGYASVEDAIRAFCSSFLRLSNATRQYLVIENDHVSFTVEDVWRIYEQMGIPVVFDNKHYEWNPGSLSYEEAVKRAVMTWKERIPKLHLSSDKVGKKHAHSDYVSICDYLKMEQALEQTGIKTCYVILECKEKDRAVIALKKQIEERNQRRER